MTYLDIPGVSLYYECVGDGPILLCISGATGNVEPWRGLAEQLKSQFTVVMYDRRGFSRSFLDGAQDYDKRIESDADDAASLINHLSPQQPAIVVASSSGAVVGLELLIRHPDVVKTLLPLEPPAHKLLPECDQITAGFGQIYEVYRKQGLQSALELFAKAVKLDSHEEAALLGAFNPRNDPYAMANGMYWMEREFPYTTRDLDLDKLKDTKDKLVPINGEASNTEAAHYRTNVALCEKLGLELRHTPGAHLGYASHPEQFATKLLEILKA